MQDDCVVVARIATALGVIVIGLLEPAHPVEAVHGPFKRNQAQSLCENFVLNDRGVVVDEDELDGEGGHLRHENAAEGVCDRGIEADQGERCFEWVIAVEFDFEALQSQVSEWVGKDVRSRWYRAYILELLYCPFVGFSGPVAWEISGGNVGDSLCIDADKL